MDDVYAWVADRRAARKAAWWRFFNETQSEWGPECRGCCCKWLRDGDYTWSEYARSRALNPLRPLRRLAPCARATAYARIPGTARATLPDSRATAG